MAVVETASGKVEGIEKRGVLQFRGIPYAAPPVGEQRFRPPQAVEAWSGTLDATAFGPIAPQNASPFHQAFGAEPPPRSEADCLNLNVWTPATDDPKRPVMVWIHGGAFVMGDGRTPWYDGVHLARRDVVIVTLNYRMGVLGFLHLEDLAGADFRGSGNCGLLDQAAALRWVNENIANFGGDPDNVTLFGESAGAMSAATLLGLPEARGLFHRAIPQSGATAHVHDRERATRTTREVLAKLRMEPERAAELRDLPVETILEAQGAVMADHWGSAEGIGLPFQPVVDHAALHVDPLEAIAVGDADEVTLLTGTTRDEMKLFSAFDPTISQMTDDEVVDRATAVLGSELDVEDIVAAYRDHLGDVSRPDLWAAILTDRYFRVPAIELSDAHAKHQPATYMYRFDFPSPAFGGILGASHAVDIPFAWDNLDAPGAAMFVGEPTDDMRTLAVAMGDAWTSFARTGKPEAADLPDWPAYAPDRRASMILDLESRVDDPDGFARSVWL